MRELRFVSSLNRTPVSLCSGTYLYRIRKESIHITTIETIHLLYEIEIVEKSAFIDKKFTSFYIRNMIETECGILIYRESNIEDNSRDDHPIDKRNREKVSDIRWDDVFPTWEFLGLVFSSELFEKYDFFLLKIKSISL